MTLKRHFQKFCPFHKAKPLLMCSLIVDIKMKRMRIEHIAFADVPQFSKRDKAYTTSDAKLRPFYHYDTSLAAFEQAIQNKKTADIDRATLVEVIRAQYADFSPSAAVQANVDALLQDNTFTVITAHQPSLFTGPLYFIYKIFSAINLAERLNERYPEQQFVPVFVLGAEDHDFEEINHLHLFNKTLEWQNEEQGATGMMQTTTLAPVLEELKGILGESENAQAIFSIIQNAFIQHKTYSKATQCLVHELFKQYGLVVCNMNEPKLKRLFAPYIKEEIINQPSEKLVINTQTELEKLGFSAQATPRAINFFYLREQIRERIVQNDDGSFEVLNTSYKFSREELLQEIDEHPERFSPNVVMRPLYQEVIFPNLAYIGGGGELAYWLERKAQFQHFNVLFPMLIRRNSVLWLDKGSTKRMAKLGLSLSTIFEGTEHLVKKYVKANTENELSLKDERTALETLFEKILSKVLEVDAGMKKSVLAEQQKQLNALEKLEAKVLRAEKNKHDVALNQLRSFKEKLFPSNGLQERHDNFMGFYLKHGQAYFDVLKAHLHPLDKTLLVVMEE